MFKKDPQPKASANIKSSERRKLLTNICNIYNIPQQEITKECEHDILPVTTKQASFKSVQGYSGTIYCDENETPIWFKSRDSQIFPSLFTTWKCPFILPMIKTHPHVIKILSNGADLMLPGTIPPSDDRAVKGAVVGVVDSQNPTVIKAIGRCKLNMTEFDRVIGRTGTAVEVIHCLHDELYNLNKLVDIPIPLECNVDIPLSAEQNEPITQESESVLQESESVTQEADKGDNKSEIDSKIENEVNNKSTNENSIGTSMDDVAEQLSELSVEDVDKFFTRSLLQSIQQNSIALPITSSTFMSNYIYKNLPIIDPIYCNIKKTTWRKSAKFLKAMEKLNYMQVKGKGDDLSIVGLTSKDNPIIQNFVPHKPMSSLTNNSNKSSEKPVGNKKNKANELSIVYLYKPTNKSRMFFNKVDVPFLNLYTAPELRSLLDKYIKIQQLMDKKDPKKIVLDDTLNSISNLGLGSYPRDKVFKAFLTNFSPLYKILKPGESVDNDEIELNRGEPPKVQVITEMKIGRKVITRVLNFEKYYIKPHILSDELKVKCSGSTTIGPCNHNPKLIEVTVQGPHGKLIVDLLNSKGIPISFIEFEDKVKKRKKR